MNQVVDIRDRVIESEKASLMKKAERRFPGQKKRQEQFVYRTLAGRYGQKAVGSQQSAVASQQSTVASQQSAVGSEKAKRLTMEELMEIPLEGCEITVTIGSSTEGWDILPSHREGTPKGIR